LAIGRRGQNVRLASKLCGWDIEIMTREELDEQIEQAVVGFGSLEGVTGELAEKLVGEGFLSYDDLSVIEPDALMEMGGLTPEQADKIVQQAEVKAAEAEKAAAQQRRAQRERDRLAAEAGPAEAVEPPEPAEPYDAYETYGVETAAGAEAAGAAETTQPEAGQAAGEQPATVVADAAADAQETPPPIQDNPAPEPGQPGAEQPPQEGQ
jgi:N utilization substance protein A